jgi:hypothetical protein
MVDHLYLQVTKQAEIVRQQVQAIGPHFMVGRWAGDRDSGTVLVTIEIRDYLYLSRFASAWIVELGHCWDNVLPSAAIHHLLDRQNVDKFQVLRPKANCDYRFSME